ncbi:hypothetical protein [uncultured Metabacillus sp.]|uniref:hypothetical protein n=1 Tax=uncultured Metabacillus sp. TaxID=2860135 RepID=UPI0026141E29|nr:hypothetical protein [uncultured Metabacillus sp.]
MKKIFSGLLLSGILVLSACGNDNTEKTSGDSESVEENTNEPSQEELNKELKEEAKPYSFDEVNNNEVEKDAKIVVEGSITGGSFGVGDKFYLASNDGAYDIVNFNTTDSTFTTNDYVKVFGTYNGKDESTGIPIISATIVEVSKNNNQTSNENDKTLSKVGQQITDDGIGTVTLDKIVNINKEYETAGLKIKMLDAKVMTITNIEQEYRYMIGITGDEFTYLQVRYDLENTSNESVIFNGLETAIPNNGKQIDIMSEDLFSYQNPMSTEIYSKASVEQNIIGIPVEKNIESIRLIPSDVLYDNDDHSIFYPEEIIIEF